MTRITLFQMWNPFRESLIERHQFYIRQSHLRLLSQFANIQEDANRAADEWLERSGYHFDPDRHDPADFYERANDEAVTFYTMLSEMREQTRLSVVAGMFHEWDKQFRDWIVREIHHWHDGKEVVAKVWAQNSNNLAELFACLGWDYRTRPYYELIDSCRLVVNVYKHGGGNSLEELRKHHVRYLEDPLANIFGSNEGRHIDYRDLKVSAEDIQQFADAITAFWKDVPEYIFDETSTAPPEWFEKAWLKDLRCKNTV